MLGKDNFEAPWFQSKGASLVCQLEMTDVCSLFCCADDFEQTIWSFFLVFSPIVPNATKMVGMINRLLR